MKKNFLNSQNYILWRREKKKLLIQFFIEKSFAYIYRFLKSINSKVNPNYFAILIYLIHLSLSWYFIMFLWFFIIDFYFQALIWFIFLIIYFFIPKNYEGINNLSDFLINFNTEKKLLYFKFLLFFIIIIPISAFSNLNINLFAILFMAIPWLLSVTNITNIIFLIIIILLFFPYIGLVLLFSLIYVFLIKWIRWYNFKKYLPQNNIWIRFNNVEKNNAENKYYKIKLKW